MKTVILNTQEKARGPIGFIGEERTPRIEQHYGIDFTVQPDGSRLATMEDAEAAEMAAAGRVLIQP